MSAASLEQLPDAVYDQITELSEDGNVLSENGNYSAALHKYEAALRFIPEPKYVWEAATWLFAAIGDCHFLLGQFDHAYDALSRARLCPNGYENPFISLRLGQALFERGELEQAKDALLDAYLVEGVAIFDDEAPKYLTFLRHTVNLTSVVVVDG